MAIAKLLIVNLLAIIAFIGGCDAITAPTEPQVQNGFYTEKTEQEKSESATLKIYQKTPPIPPTKPLPPEVAPTKEQEEIRNKIDEINTKIDNIKRLLDNRDIEAHRQQKQEIKN